MLIQCCDFQEGFTNVDTAKIYDILQIQKYGYKLCIGTEIYKLCIGTEILVHITEGIQLYL